MRDIRFLVVVPKRDAIPLRVSLATTVYVVAAAGAAGAGAGVVGATGAGATGAGAGAAGAASAESLIT